MNTKKKAVIVVSAIFAVLGLVALLVGGYMAGWDILGWFSSQYAYVFYVLVALYALAVLSVIMTDWVKKR